jgi:hypothetical protein
MKVRLDPAAERREAFGDQTDPEETFDVLVYDQLNREPMLANIYTPPQEQKHLFTLNRYRYCRRSKFFREELERAQSSSSDSNTRKRVKLENHLPDDFATYMQYVEIGRADLAVDGNDPLFPLLRLYVLADQLCDFTIANFIMNDIIQTSDEYNHTPSKKEIWFVWTMIGESTHPLKRLFVDYQIHQAPTESLVFDEMDNIPFEYLNDVVFEYSTLSRQKGWRGQAERSDDMFGIKCSERPECHYHQHNKDVNHPSCRELGLSSEPIGGGE